MIKSNDEFRNPLRTAFWRYEFEYVWICELVGSWCVQMQSYNLSLNMWKPEIVQLKSGKSIVVELTFVLPSHVLHSYVTVDHIYNFESWRNRYKNLVLISKNKKR